MTLDLAPAPAAASPARRIAAHARTELTLLLRNGEQLLLAVVIPVALLVAGHFFGGPLGIDLDLLAPSVLGLAVWSTAFTSLAIMTGFERRDGVLERLAATPLGRTGLIAGKACAVTAIALGQSLLLGGIAVALGWRPEADAWGVLVGIVAAVLAGFAFAGAALLIAGRLKAEVTLALANLVYLVGLGAGQMVPFGAFPAAVRPVLWAFPPGALGETLRLAATGDTVAWPLLLLLVWAVGLVVAARKAMRWMS